MNIRKAKFTDIPKMMEIYDKAREFMRENGNPTQWSGGYPSKELIESDIAKGWSHVCEDEGEIVGVFVYFEDIDPTYGIIVDGKWLSDEPYGVIHRIASVKKGVGTFCINYGYEKCGNLRIDTHENNHVMQNLLTKLGFKRCGIIFLENGEERIAFQKV